MTDTITITKDEEIDWNPFCECGHYTAMRELIGMNAIAAES